MRRRHHVLPAVVAIVMMAAAGPAAAGDTPQAFIARLRDGVRAGNRRAVASMFRYPLRVNAVLPIPLDNAQTTLELYRLLFTPEMRCAIELAQVPQDGRPVPKYPLRTSGGALTLGSGLLVAELTGGQYKITRISAIGMPDGHKPGVPSHAEAVDLRFSGSRQFAGNLAGDEFDRYTVRVTAGTQLRGTLERFRGLDAAFHVTDLKGVAVDGRADGRRTWAGGFPSAGQYRIDIVRKAPFCDPPLTYLLTLTVK